MPSQNRNAPRSNGGIPTSAGRICGCSGPRRIWPPGLPRRSGRRGRGADDGVVGGSRDRDRGACDEPAEPAHLVAIGPGGRRQAVSIGLGGSLGGEVEGQEGVVGKHGSFLRSAGDGSGGSRRRQPWAQLFVQNASRSPSNERSRLSDPSRTANRSKPMRPTTIATIPT